MHETRLEQNRHRPVVEQYAFDDNGKAEGRQQLARHEDQAVNGRDPTRVERHDPVDRGERDGDRVEDDAGGAYYFEARAGIGERRMVVLEGKLAEQVLQHEPDRKVNHSADHEAAVVEEIAQNIGVFFEVLAYTRIGDGIEWHRPRIKPGHGKEQRNKQQDQQRQRAHGGPEDAPDHRAPSAAGHVTDHDDGHRPKAYAQPIHVREQVSAEEDRRVREGEEKRDHARDAADDERPLPDDLDD